MILERPRILVLLVVFCMSNIMDLAVAPVTDRAVVVDLVECRIAPTGSSDNAARVTVN
jgi:hypothetical protein